jgi:Zn-finger nucleic acid-binding protein
MQQHFFSVQRSVAIDECPACGGVWLDAGELAQIRELYPSEAEREKAAEQYFDDVFGDELAAMQAESQQRLASARKIAHIFRFICPSYYIPGKQKWGAF